MGNFLLHWRKNLLKKSSKYKGLWTNNSTDIILKVLAVRHVYNNGFVKVKYLLYNKRNGIEYEKGHTKLRPEFFKLNYQVSLHD